MDVSRILINLLGGKGMSVNVNNVSDLAETNHQDIAILGFSCRFPGKVANATEFFDFLLAGGDGIVRVPSDRWDADSYYDADKDKKNKMYVNRGGFIEDIDLFEPQFFGISPKEAPAIDPQHRWLLELCYQAFENSGLKPSELRGSNTAVYVGQFMHDYEQIQVDALSRGLMSSHSATGPSMTLTSNRISYIFDFIGPSVTLDTACSSSLVALDHACQAILRGDSDIALAGGVNILLRPEMTMSICKASMLSPDGLCKSFDASANGYVRSEGAAVVVLKRLSDALRDGDPVLAVIKATGVNQDGQTKGITVPNGESQQKLFHKSLGRAGLCPEDIQYLEAHGTGTPVGDPIEINAMGAALSSRHPEHPACLVGSVKSNIGHTEAVAGMAGLIKTVMAMNKGVIPRNIHLQQVNPAISLQDLNIRLLTENTRWPDVADRPRRALVNSFGFGGTNANAIIQQAPRVNYLTKADAKRSSLNHYWLPISAKTSASLKALASKYLEFLNAPESPDLLDICYTAALKRDHFKQRLAIAGASKEELIAVLEKYLAGEPGFGFAEATELPETPEKFAFVFSGMGTQWIGMGKELYAREPLFTAAMDRCDAALAAYTGWSLVDKLYTNPVSDINNRTEIAQPAIFSVQYALVELLAAWDIKPSWVVGHSAGEVAAAYAAGALDFDDAIKVIYHRSHLQATTEGMGKMLAVGLAEADVNILLQGRADKVSIAAVNSAEAITLAGCAKTLEQIAGELDKKGVFARFLNVGIPYHSPVMDQIKAPLIAVLANIKVHKPHTPLYSSVSGQRSDESDWNAHYWADNVREAVLFKDAVDAMINDGARLFVEVAAHPALSSSIEKNLQQQQVDGRSVACLKRDLDGVVLLRHLVAQLYAAGAPLNWKGFYAGGETVLLPNYTWVRSSYWSEDAWAREARLYNRSGHKGLAAPVHKLLGSQLASSVPLWQKNLDLQELTFLRDHRVEAEIVYPAAAYVETGLALAFVAGDVPQVGLESQRVILENLQFHRAFFPSEAEITTIETSFDNLAGHFKISAVNPQTEEWTYYSEGHISKRASVTPVAIMQTQVIKNNLPYYFDKAGFYAHCKQLGLHYHAAFQAVEECWYAERESLVRWVLPAELEQDQQAYHLHPAILDGAFQGLFPTIQRGYLPVKIRELDFHSKPGRSGYAHLVTHFKNATDIRGDITIVNDSGELLVKLLDIELKASNTQSAQALNDGMLYDFRWQPLAGKSSRQPASGSWLIFADNQLAKEWAAQLAYDGGNARVIDPKTCASVADVAALLKANQPPLEGIIFVTGSSAHISANITGDIDSSEIMQMTEAVLLPALHLVQAIVQVDILPQRGLFFVTQRAQPVVLDGTEIVKPQQAALWGFGRVLASEHPELKLGLIDIESPEELVDELFRNDYEQEVALRPSGRFVNRLRAIKKDDVARYIQTPLPLSDNANLQLMSTDGHWQLVQTPPLVASGAECLFRVELACFDASASRESAAAIPTLYIGKVKEQLELGQYIALDNQVCSSITINPEELLPLPVDINLARLTRIFSDYLLPHYCFNHSVYVSPQTSILVLGADTTMGVAVIKLLQAKGAHIYVPGHMAATTSVDYIVSLGDEAITFDQVKFLSATGSWLHLSESALPGNIQRVLVDKQLGFQWLALSKLIAGKRKSLMQDLRVLISHMDDNLNTIEVPHAYDINLFAEHPVALVGRVHLSMLKRPTRLIASKAALARADGSYLITGGLGGLGLAMMDWLVDAGAAAVVLVSRSKPTTEAAAQIAKAKARQPSVTITTWQADIAKADDVIALIAMIDKELPPLRGLIHSAGVLDDGVIVQQDRERFAKVLGPKVLGSWNLHRYTQHCSLDFFVCFSSVASVVGWAGQSNYAAGNAFMDSLAYYRRHLGLPALSINWGPWAEAGMAASLEARDIRRMEAAGMYALKTRAGIAAMEELLQAGIPNAAVLDMDWSKVLALYSDQPNTLLQELAGDNKSSADTSLKDELLVLADAERQSRLLEVIKNLLAETIGLDDATQIDSNTNVFEYGINSLMAMEFKSRLQTMVGVNLPATLVLKYPTAKAMLVPVCAALDAYVNEQSATGSNTAVPVGTNPNDASERKVYSLPNKHTLWKNDHEHHWNISQLLEIANANLDHLEYALRLIIEQNEGLRHCFYRDEQDRIHEKIMPVPDHPIMDIIDLSDIAPEQQSAQVEFLSNQFQGTLEFSKKLYRFVYFHLGDGQPGRFLSIIHHAVFDGYSGMLFGRDLHQKILAMSRGEVPPVPAKTTSVNEWGRYLHNYINSPHGKRGVHFWTDLPWHRGKSLIDFPEGLAENKSENEALHGQEIKIVKYLKPEYSEYLLQKGNCNSKYSINDAVLAALASALASMTTSHVVSFNYVSSGRHPTFDEVDLSGTIGWLLDVVPLLFTLDSNASIEEKLAQVSSQFAQLPNNGLDFNALKYLSHDQSIRDVMSRIPTPEIMVNYIPFVPGASLSGGLISQNELATSNEPVVSIAKESPGKTEPDRLSQLASYVMIQVIDAQFTITWHFPDNVYKKETIDRVTTLWQWEMEAIVKFCMQSSGVSNEIVSLVENV
jgi:non-ribosomal peptide synthase protein (TIGR01720 family)